MDSFFYIGLGGFLGANARYFLTQWAQSYFIPRWGAFPYGTLLVNVLGSFGLALLAVWFSARAGLSPQLRLLLGAGFFGAFTTFSTFANESVALLDESGPPLFLLNLLLNNGLCLLGVAAGLFIGKRILGVA